MALGLILLAILIPGCEDKRRHATGRSVDFGESASPVGADAGADAVAMAVLDALREAQLSRSRGLGHPESLAAYEDAMGRLRSLAATAEIHEQLKSAAVSLGLPKNLSAEAAVTHAIENWVSIVAHYVEGYQMASLGVSEVVPNEQAVAFINAENPGNAKDLAELREGSSGAAASAPADDEIRQQAIRRGIVPPGTAGIEIRLKKIDGSWRVLRLGIGPARHAS